MMITMLKSKLHRATVTETNINYAGSITIDKQLMKQADILAGEKVQIVNINNGARLETYTISGETDSGIVSINGAAARLIQPGDKIIIVSYIILDKNKAKSFEPKILVLNDDNKVSKVMHNEKHGKIE